jgi:hypothetical protein
MFVSTKTPAIDFFALQASYRLSLPFSILSSKKLLKPLATFCAKLLLPGQGMQIVSHKSAYRGIILGCFAAGAPVDFVTDAYGDVLHQYTVTVKL